MRINIYYFICINENEEKIIKNSKRLKKKEIKKKLSSNFYFESFGFGPPKGWPLSLPLNLTPKVLSILAKIC